MTDEKTFSTTEPVQADGHVQPVEEAKAKQHDGVDRPVPRSQSSKSTIIEPTDEAAPGNGAVAERSTRKQAQTQSRRKEKKASTADAEGEAKPSRVSKTELALKALRRKRGASVSELQDMTGWQAHSVRGFLSGTVKKKLELPLMSEVGKDAVRRYRVTEVARSS